MQATDRRSKEQRRGMKRKSGRARTQEVEHQFCVWETKLGLRVALEQTQAETKRKESQEQIKEKKRSGERRTSGRTTVTLMKGDFGAMTSLFFCPQGDTCCLTRSRMHLKSQERNTITNVMIVQMRACPSVSIVILVFWSYTLTHSADLSAL